MLANVPRLRTGVIAVTLASLAACDDPVASTDLRPEGDPEILSVLVMNDPADNVGETATFCKTDDEKRPGFVASPVGGLVICDADLSVGAEPVTDAVPTNWYVRVMFDELLDPTVEELLPIIDDETMLETGQSTGSIAGTLPVILTCDGVSIDYDGYYSPSGNSVTWPLGPSLFVAPLDPSAIATSSDCTIEIKDTVTDKGGAAVPPEQRGSGGEYAFSIAALALQATSPKPAAMGAMAPLIVPTAPVKLTFNAFIDAASLTADEVIITEHAMDDCSDAGTVVADPNKVIAASGATAITLATNNAGAMNAWNPESAYSITFLGTNGISDVAGGEGQLPATFNLCFRTNTAAP